MLESLFKGVMIIGLGLLLVGSLYVVDECEFTSHWNPAHPSCIEAGRSVRVSTVATVQDLFERGPSRGLRANLHQLRTEAELLHQDLSDLATGSVTGLDQWITENRGGAIRWCRTQIDHFVDKF